MNTDPRQQPDWIEARYIAEDLLNFPLNKPPQELYDRNRKKDYPYHEENKLGGLLRETDTDPPLSKEEDSTSHMIGHSATAYGKLYKALMTLSKGRKLSSNRKTQIQNIIRHAPVLVEMLARESDEFAVSEGADTNFPKPDTMDWKMWEDAAQHQGVSMFDPDFVKKRTDRASQNYDSDIAQAANLRGEVMVLFEQLATALGIELDRGQAHGH